MHRNINLTMYLNLHNQESIAMYLVDHNNNRKMVLDCMSYSPLSVHLKKDISLIQVTNFK